MNEVWVLIVTAVGTAAGALGVEFWHWYQHRTHETREMTRQQGGILTGKWIESVAANRISPARRDHVICIESGEQVYGTIGRFHPATQSHRQYQFYGTVQGKAIYCAFWPSNESGDRGSYGSFFLSQRDSNTWVGYCVSFLAKPESHASEIEGLGPFTPTAVKWTLDRKSITAEERTEMWRPLGGT